MEAALNGLANTAKNPTIKDAVTQAKEAVKNGQEKRDVPIAYIREKCLGAFELAFDHGNEKAAHYAVEGVQALLRDSRFHSTSLENPQHNLPTQVLLSMTGIAQWSPQLQCHCLTLLVEMICSTELKVSLQQVEESLELCMRVFGSSREESVRVSARAAVSQSITAYFSNRYASGEESQDLIAVYLDATKLLESYVTKLEQLSASSDQSVVLFDATNALLTAQPLSIQKHIPLINLLWEKLCPLMIRLLGVPVKNIPSTATVSTEEPVGQGQIAKFALSPAVIANPEATRALYQIVEQLIRIMAGIPSVSSVLEAVFHKAFLFPKIEQRNEAIKMIRKILSDKRRIADLVSSAVLSRTLSLWRMLIICLAESSSPQYEISIEAVRACGSMLQGIMDFCSSSSLPDNIKEKLREMFPSLKDATSKSFTSRSDAGQVIPCSVTENIAQENLQTITVEDIESDEIAETLKKLTQKFEMEIMGDKILGDSKKLEEQEEGRCAELNESSEVTAKKFVDTLYEHVSIWSQMRSTLNVDEGIAEFSASFHSDFSAVHNEAFNLKSKVQQEFLNMDAIYLTTYATLSLAIRGDQENSWDKFRDSVLLSGCIVYVSESWLRSVFDSILSTNIGDHISGPLLEVIKDYDGLDYRLLSDVERLQKISQGGRKPQPYEELLASRWLMTAAWDSVVHILSTFLGIKERRKARQKILEGIEHSIHGIQQMAILALNLNLGDRCGWIFANLVEASCDLEELRTTATGEDQKRWRMVTREDLLSIQLVLDNAFVSIHASECWKHVIRCTEYVWELEKFIYGALCYEKPSVFSFGRKKKEEKHESKPEEGIPAADRTVEGTLGEKELDKDNINRALCILIAKVDRFYNLCGRQLNLRALRELCVALVGASENRIIFSDQKAPALTPSTTLLSRISEVLVPLPNRPLVHQMLVWPIVSGHFIQVASSTEESRNGVMALSECVSSLLLSESLGMCFNQMLIAPFQAIVCSESCSPETREQLVSSLADFVRTRSDKIGSGWKPLFGTLRAVRTVEVEDASVHWTVLDVIGTYLGINKPSILSWSLPDCLPCIVHFLQSTIHFTNDSKNVEESGSLDDRLSEVALRLVTPTYTVILNLFRTPHIPNHNLLHRLELRSRYVEEVEGRADCLEATVNILPPLSSILDPVFFSHEIEDPSPIELDSSLEVSLGILPWINRSSHEAASVELLLSLVEQLSGTLVTAPPRVQPPLLKTIQDLLSTIKESEFGINTASFCISTLLLPHVQKWLRRRKDEGDERRNIKQAIGTCTQIVTEFSRENANTWRTRLVCDICRLAAECTAQEGDVSRVGAACLRYITTVADHFERQQWMVLAKTLWDASAATLHPIRLLISLFVCDSAEEKGDLGEILIDGAKGLVFKDRMLAEQVFLVDSQKCTDHTSEFSSEDQPGNVELILTKSEWKHRLPLSYVVSSLLAHQIIIQILGSILISSDTLPHEMKGIFAHCQSHAIKHQIPKDIRMMMYHCLDASFQVARDMDSRRGLIALLSKCMRIPYPNLYKQLVSASHIKMYSLYLDRDDSAQNSFKHLQRSLEMIIQELKVIEKRTAEIQVASATREYQEERFEFMLVENDAEKLLKLVSEDEINNTIAAYQKQRPITIPAKQTKARQNPFLRSITNEISDEDPKVNLDTLRLLAYREICVFPAKLTLDEGQRKYLHAIIPSINNLILATPDLAVRQLAVKIIEELHRNNP